MCFLLYLQGQMHDYFKESLGGWATSLKHISVVLYYLMASLDNNCVWPLYSYNYNNVVTWKLLHLEYFI